VRDFARQLVAAEALGAMLPDGRSPTKDRALQRAILNLKYLSEPDAVTDLLVPLTEVPSMGDSTNHAGIRLADVVASGLLYPMACAACSSELGITRPKWATRAREVYGDRLADLQYPLARSRPIAARRFRGDLRRRISGRSSAHAFPTTEADAAPAPGISPGTHEPESAAGKKRQGAATALGAGRFTPRVELRRRSPGRPHLSSPRPRPHHHQAGMGRVRGAATAVRTSSQSRPLLLRSSRRG
jgi:hypothetical protein